MAAARLLSAEVLRQRALGHDPVADNKAQKHRARLVAEERAGNTFGAAACDFVVEYKIKKKGRRPRRWAEVARCLGFTIALSEDSKTLTATPIKHGLADKWAAKPIAEITEDDLFIVVRDAQRGGIPGLTKRIKGTSDARGRKMADALSGFFRWLKKERRIPVNLMRDIEWRPAAGKRRLRRLSDDELRWLWHGLDAAVKAHEVPKSFAAMVRLLLVTATRRDEARLMMSTEFKNNDWIIPAARVKSDVSHLVPLSTLARDILLRQADARGFVFTLDRERPLGAMSKWKAALDARMLALARQEGGPTATIPSWTFHDFRRNARTFLSRLASTDVAERCLGHVIGGVRAHYDLYEFEKEKRAALELWAREIERIVAGKAAKVMPLKRQGK